ARNFIGWTPNSGTPTPAEVKAFLKDSAVQAGGDLSLITVAHQSIDSIVIAGSAAIALGGTAGVAFSGSGVFAENKIGVDVKSYIDGDGDSGSGSLSTDSGTLGGQAKSVTLTADDPSRIDAIAGAVSLAFAVGGQVGVSISVGVALARNTITSQVDAYITDADGQNADASDPATLNDYGVDATGSGGITVRATEDASIHAISVAASLSAGIGVGAAGIAVSGAGADANNIILTGTHAYIQGSSVHSAGKVDMDAANTATIDAAVVSASVSVGIGLYA